MKKVHQISGVLIALFVGLHLFNHFMGIFGAEVHIRLMNDLRPIYRNPISEILLPLSIFVQITSGLRLFLFRRKLIKGFYESLQLWSGLYLAFFLVIHITAVLLGRHNLNLDTNFFFGVAGLNTFPLNLFFIPYYGLAILSFYGHISAIHFLKMKKKFFGLTVNQQAKWILIKGIIVTFLIFYGLTNGFSGVDVPKEYNIIIGK